MQSPTCVGTRIRNVRDAHIVFQGVMCSELPMITRRLDTEERRAVCAGNVYVWEERGRNADASNLGIERWTDGIRWSASRVRDEFLLYHERYDTDIDTSDGDTASEQSYALRPEQRRNSMYNRLVKQTYSVVARTRHGDRKWHMTAYFIPASVETLKTVDDHPVLSRLQVLPGTYISAKMGKGRALNPYSSVHDGGGSFVAGSEGNPTLYSYPYYQQQQYPTSSAYASAPPQAFAEQPVDVANVLPLPNLSRSGQSTYLPRHPLDDAALRALRGGF